MLKFCVRIVTQALPDWTVRDWDCYACRMDDCLEEFQRWTDELFGAAKPTSAVDDLIAERRAEEARTRDNPSGKGQMPPPGGAGENDRR